jgi:hypothetical protein
MFPKNETDLFAGHDSKCPCGGQRWAMRCPQLQKHVEFLTESFWKLSHQTVAYLKPLKEVSVWNNGYMKHGEYSMDLIAAVGAINRPLTFATTVLHGLSLSDMFISRDPKQVFGNIRSFYMYDNAHNLDTYWKVIIPETNLSDIGHMYYHGDGDIIFDDDASLSRPQDSLSILARASRHISDQNGLSNILKLKTRNHQLELAYTLRFQKVRIAIMHDVFTLITCAARRGESYWAVIGRDVRNLIFSLLSPRDWMHDQPTADECRPAKKVCRPLNLRLAPKTSKFADSVVAHILYMQQYNNVNVRNTLSQFGNFMLTSSGDNDRAALEEIFEELVPHRRHLQKLYQELVEMVQNGK